ncbi:hypothetical protein LEMLEM_LOCUS4644, partial [Lemmus lemmus]
SLAACPQGQPCEGSKALSTVLHVRNPLTQGTTGGREEMAGSSEPWTGMIHSNRDGHSLARPQVPYFRTHPKQKELLSSRPRPGLVGAAQWPGPSSLKVRGAGLS